MIRLDRATLRRGGRDLVAAVSLTLSPGEVLAIVGPNGAGKSSLMKLCSGELLPDAGHAAFDDRPLAGWDPLALARRRAVVSQKVALSFPMRAVEVAALGRLPWHGTAAQRHDRAAVAGALARAGVSALAQRPYALLSGGEQQRVQIARALAQLEAMPRPAALLLDEPTASLDPGHRASLLRLLRILAAEGVAVAIVLHDLNEARFVADRVALLAEGRLLAEGTPDDVLRPELLAPVYGVGFRAVEGGGLLAVY
ncbi:heme ABC transporter ATP-binding protein [Roseomonas sp. 18066]|uniref:heme ABC transporter ATP-binding protein n=1 Tax=Roseomonas sp. 18066 TaxID=2681412 RepID=UPI001358413B|nr:heme ABC transporter ATP-binding protein [Roseomonas sp. 18066]